MAMYLHGSLVLTYEASVLRQGPSVYPTLDSNLQSSCFSLPVLILQACFITFGPHTYLSYTEKFNTFETPGKSCQDPGCLISPEAFKEERDQQDSEGQRPKKIRKENQPWFTVG